MSRTRLPTIRVLRRVLTTGALLGTLLLIPAVHAAEGLHLLIPAGPGGGLDSTARALGNALMAGQIRDPVSYENMIGGGGGRAMAYFVETAERQQDTLLVNSTPLVIRALTGLFPHSFRDVTPVAGLVGEYGVIAVRADSGIRSWGELIEQLKLNPRAASVGGGSARGSLDHIVIARALDLAGVDPRAVRYLPYDAGAKAMLALLGGEIGVLSTGMGEALAYQSSGDVRILAVTAAERLERLPDVPTLTELGTPFVFANWRGVFGPAGLPAQALETYQAEIEQALASKVWADAANRYGWTMLHLYGGAFGAYLAAQEAELRVSLTRLGLIRE